MTSKLLLTLLGVLLVKTTHGCDTQMIYDCFDVQMQGELYGFPLMLAVPEADRDLFCQRISAFSTCLDAFRDECTFDENESYWAYEEMGYFLCDDLTSYGENYDVISDPDHQSVWENVCLPSFEQLDGTEPGEVGCSYCEEFLNCYLQTIDDESNSTQAYIQQYGDAALTDYYDYYGCSSGDNGSSVVRLSFGLIIASLSSLFWVL